MDISCGVKPKRKIKIKIKNKLINKIQKVKINLHQTPIKKVSKKVLKIF
jgi:hypothetical protein